MVVPGSGSKTYDGTPLTKNEHDDFTVTGVPEGFTWTATADGTVTNVTPGEGEKAENAVTSFQIFNADGEDVTDQFANINTSAKGTLTINKRPVTLTSADGEKEYDGTPLTKNAQTDVTVSGDGFVEGEGATYNITGTQTLVGSSENTFTYTLKNGTLADNYTINTVYGTLTVTDENIPNDLVVTKNDDKADTYKYAEGETVTFNITVKNVYAEAKTITLSEIEGVTLAQSTFNNVPAGETVTTTATYTIKPADMSKGSFTNTVTATLEGKDYTATDTVSTEAVDAALTVTKTANPTSGVKVGDEVEYTVVVTNSGNATITGIALSDTLVTLSEPAFDLAPGASKEITYTYTVLQKDVDAGKIDNTVTATGKDPKGAEKTATASATVTTVTKNAKLTVEKTAAPAENVAAGATVTYTVKVTNSGNVTVSGITLADTLVTPTGDNAAAFDLAPGKDKTFTYTYEVTQADVDKGEIKNTATATGKDPQNKEVKASDDATVTTVDSDAKLVVAKTAAPTSGVKVGDEVEYTVVVTNAGNVTITDVTLDDNLVTLTDAQKAVGTLAPAGTKTITYTYTVTQDDVDAGKINNTVTATGKDNKGKTLTTSASAEVTTVDAAPELTVTKTPDPKSGVKVGDTVTYTVNVKNTGNVTVTGIAMKDTLVSLSEAAFDLAPGKDKSFTYTYTVTQADVDAGKIDNTVTATGKDPANKDVTGTANATVTTVEAKAELTVTKTADPTKDVKVNDTVTYTVVVKNTGNVTVSAIELEDTLVILNETAFDLAPGAEKEITYTYTAKQADVDAGEIKNTVTATGKDPKDKDVTGTASATVMTVEADAKLTVEKTATPTSGVQVGSIVTYKVVVTNSGNVTITGINLADDKMSAADKPEAFDLAPGKDKTITYTYTVTQNDIDEGTIENVATATGKDPKNNDVTASDDATVTATTSDAKLTVAKTATPSSGVEVGDTVTYKVTVSNTGNVTVKNIALTDSKVTLTEAPFTLAPGETHELTYTYTVTQADVDAGEINNTVTATGKDPKDKDVTGSANAKVTTVTATPALTVEKTASPTSNVKVGDTVTYTVTVTNSGNVTVSGIEMSDTLVTLTEKAFDLAPGAEKTITYTYTVTQADVDAGKIDNTATATGKDPKNEDVTASDDATVTTVTAAAALTVEKTANPTSGVKVNDTVTYTVKVTNSGNVTVTGIALTDTLVTLNEEAFDLAPGASNTITYTYTVTQADVDAGKIDNTATATGKDPQKKDVTASDDATVTTVTADPKLTVTKTAAPTSGIQADGTVTYTVVVTNSGNVTVTGITLADAKMAAADAPAAFDLAPGASKTVTYTYVATQADVDAGKIDNTVTATGKDPANKDVTGTASATVTTVESDAKLAVTKTADPASGVAVGDTVTYKVVVSNPGNVTVKDIALTDNLVTLTEAAFTLAPNAKKEFTYTYEVTQADVDAGEIDNTVTAKGTDPKNNEVSNSATAKVTTEAADPKLTVKKTATPTKDVKVGDTVNYKVIVSNTGNVTVKGITLADTLVTVNEAAFDLAPGAEKEITYTYTVVQADVDKGQIDNTATATGKDPKNADVTANDSAKVTTVAADPKLTVKKTADPTKDVAVGDTVEYTVVVTNSGNVTVTGIELDDTLVNLNEEAFTLAPSASKTITYEYTVTQADVDAGKIDNTATATGKDPKNEDVTAKDKATVTTEEADAEITVTKEATPMTGVGAGAEVAYKVTVENTGNVTVTGITLEDTLVADVAKTTAFDLAPGAKKEITYTYTATQADVDAGEINNIVTATGKDPKKEDVTDEASVTVKTVDSDAKLEVTKTAVPTSGLEVGNTVKYTVKVTNSGNVTVKNITLTDTLVTLTEAAFDLAPGTSKTITYNYTVTQADVDAGKIDNTVTATGKDPKNNDVSNTATATVNTVTADAELTVQKTAEPTKDVAVGDTVKYTVTVTNSGNVTVKSIALTDTLVTLNEEAFDLAPGASKTVTYNYTVLQADIDAGKIENTATATGKDPKNADVTASDDATVTAEAAEPGLTVKKTANPSKDVKTGDTITYTVTVTNSGNVTVSDITLDDSLEGITLTEAQKNIGTLAPGETKTVTYTYTVTQADFDAGVVSNAVTATGTDPGDDPVPGTDEIDVPAGEAAAKLSITKEADPKADVAVGDKITYTVVVKNEGNVSVTTGKLVDDHADLTGETFALAPGESKSFEYTYTVTQADIDAGSIVNVVKANAKAVRGDDPAEVSATATVTAETAEAKLAITKTADPTEDVAVGDTITYTVVVKNTGNVGVKDGKLADDHADLSKETFTLAPNAEATFTYTYKVTQADIDNGEIVNVVKANATAVRGDNPKEVSATATVKAEEQKPSIKVTKTADPTKDVKVGDKIKYTVTVENDGNVTVKGITLEDSLVPGVAETPAFDLAPGETKTINYEYTVTQADFDKGEIKNAVKATGTDPGDDPVPDEDEVIVPAKDPTPELTVTKTADPTKDVKVGDEITYTVVVKNTGDISVKDGKLSDDHADLADKTFTLAPNETATFRYTYTVTQADFDKGEIVNVVKANATAVRGDDPKEATATATVTAEDTEAQLSIDKTSNSQSVAVGDKVQYSVTVKNTGDVTVKDGKIEDDHADLSKETFTLEPGEEKTFTYEYEVTQDDVDAGSITNVAIANATAVRGADPEEVTDSVTVSTEDAGAALSITKTADPTKDVAVGDTITYTVVVKNTGNVTVKDGKLEDDHADLSKETFKLKPGEEATFTYTYKVLQSDVDAGEIVNKVAANGTAVRGDDPKEVTATATVTAEKAEAKISVDKTAEPMKDVEVGDEITYTVVVKNEGNVTVKSGELEDSLVTLTGKTFELAPDETATFTYTYTVTQADVDAQEIVNVVKANAKAVRGDDPKEATDTVTVKTVPADPELTVTKTAKPDKDVAVNDVIKYTVTVENTGNVTIKDIEVDDTLVDLSVEPFTLAPGEVKTINYEYTVTQADVDAGHVKNAVTATGTNPGGEPTPGDDEIDVPTEPADPKIDVEKTSSKQQGVDLAEGDTITYTVTVTNEGNVTLHDVKVVDELTGDTWTVETLAPDATETFEATYTITAADDKAGTVTNTVTAEGTDPFKTKVEDEDSVTDVVGHNDIVPIPDPDDPGESMDAESKSITVMYDGKTHTVSGSATREGSTIWYSVDGGKTWSEEPPTRVNVGETEFSIKATNPDYEDVVKDGYKLIVTPREVILTSADDEKVYDGKPLTNDTITVTGDGFVEGEGATYDVTGSQLNAGQSENEFTYTLNEGTLAENYKIEVVFGTLVVTPYTDKITVTITGNTDEVEYDGHEHTVEGYTFETDNDLYTEDDFEFTGNDVARGTRANNEDNPEYNMGMTSEDFKNISENFTNIEFVVNDGSLIVDKRPITFTSASDEKTYDGTPLTNDEVTISGDGLADTDTVTFDVTGSQTLVGTSKNTFDYEFGTKEASLGSKILGFFGLASDAFADDEDDVAANYEVTKVEGDLTVTDDEVPDDKVVKKTHDDGETYGVGDTVVFTIEVTNIYDEAKDITVTEQPGVTIIGKSEFKDVEPGATITVTAEYTVTEEDIANGSFTNTVEVSFDGERDYTGDDEVDKFGHLTVEKTITNTPKDGKVFRTGETIKYKIVVTNDGTQTMKNIVVKDELTGDEWTIKSLKAGQSKTFKAEYVVTKQDGINGKVTNVATAEGEDPDGDNTPGDPGEVTTKTDKPLPGPSPIPKTGDTTQLMGYMLMMSAGLLGLILVSRRKKERA